MADAQDDVVQYLEGLVDELRQDLAHAEHQTASLLEGTKVSAQLAVLQHELKQMRQMQESIASVIAGIYRDASQTKEMLQQLALGQQIVLNETTRGLQS